MWGRTLRCDKMFIRSNRSAPVANRRASNSDSIKVPLTRPPGAGVLAALEGAALIAGHLVATPLIGQKRLQWGTEGSEATAALPGDSLVAEPKWSYTLGVGIDAPPEDVWPWIAQIGQGRGGFYTYQTLENLAGCKVTNTTEILEEHQNPAVGNAVHLHPTTPPMRIEIAEPPHALVLFGEPADIGEEEAWGVSTWQFVVRDGSPDRSRFLTRGRYDYAPGWKSRLAFGRFPIEVISFVMSRKMMLEVKRLAERDA